MPGAHEVVFPLLDIGCIWERKLLVNAICFWWFWEDYVAIYHNFFCFSLRFSEIENFYVQGGNEVPWICRTVCLPIPISEPSWRKLICVLIMQVLTSTLVNSDCRGMTLILLSTGFNGRRYFCSRQLSGLSAKPPLTFTRVTLFLSNLLAWTKLKSNCRLCHANIPLTYVICNILLFLDLKNGNAE